MDHKHVLVADFETFYDSSDKYSLSSMTAEEYINDPRFSIIMLSVKHNDGATESRYTDDPDFEEWLYSFPWSDAIVLAHNGQFFDFLILAWVYGIHAYFWLDTIAMARPHLGIKGSASLAALCDHFNLPPKGDEVHNMNGVHLHQMTPLMRQRYRAYCHGDVNRCYEVAGHLIDLWRAEDLAWIHICCRMAAQPIFEFDRAMLRDGLKVEADRKARQLELVASLMNDYGIERPIVMSGKDKGTLLPIEKLLGSAQHITTILEGIGCEVPMKWSEKQEKYVLALSKTDEFVRDVLDGKNDTPGVAEVIEARLGTKSTITASRLTRFDGIAERMGTWPVPIGPFYAHTSRDSGAQRVNAQNIPSRESKSNPLGKAHHMRRAIKAPAGYEVLDADEAQVEVRVLCALAGQLDVLETFKTPGASPYPPFGSKLYNRAITKKGDPFEYSVAKSAVLGNGFGQGGAGFEGYCKRSGILISPEEAQRTVKVYRDAHPEIVDFWKQCEWALSRIVDGYSDGTFGYRGCLRVMDGGVRLPSGYLIRYRGLQREKRPARWDPTKLINTFTFFDPVKRARREVYGSLCCENVVQGTASQILKRAAVRLGFQYDIWARLQVHDALVFVEPVARRPYVIKHVSDKMRDPPPWLSWIPLDIEIDAGPNYGTLKTLHDI